MVNLVDLSSMIETTPEYISPSSFKTILDCEFEFFLMRMSGMGLPKPQQTRPMACGSAFDAFVKAEIAYRMGKTNEPKNLLANLLENVDPAHASVIPAAHALFDLYVERGCLNALLDEGLSDIELTTNIKINGVPIFGKPDARLKVMPADWKVNGFESQYGASPKPGYKRTWPDKGEHEKAHLNMEDIDEGWATQLLFYNWMLGNEPPYYGAIEQVAIRHDRVVFASYRNRIGDSFASKIQEQLTDFWFRMVEGKFKKPEASKQLCEPYGVPKVCTFACPAYKQVKAVMEI